MEAARPRDNVLLGPLGSQMDTNFCCPLVILVCYNTCDIQAVLGY